jgi:adenine-specific DNA-methyltransferase
MDFLDYMEKHDLIVGNPPFFVIDKSEETELCQDSRPNMFVQFLYKALEYNLESGGVLAFVLPTSLYNCCYYEKMLRYLKQHTTVLAVEPLSGKYLETQQSTFVLVVQEAWYSPKASNFFLEVSDNVYLTPHKSEMEDLMQGSSSLKDLGFSVRTGTVVWNQEKDKLSDEGTLVVYDSNIRDGELVLGVKEPKRQYINGFKRDPLSGRAILINRGHGNTTYSLNAVLIDHPEFYAENHVNVVRPTTEEAIDLIEKVYSSLQSQKTAEFIRLFVGNGAMSQSQLEKCLPVWIDA